MKRAKVSLIHHYWELLYVLAEANLKERYRGSVLGVYWSLLSPLIMTGLYTAVLGTKFSAEGYYTNPRIENSLLNYALAVFTGLIVITFFSSATLQALRSVVENGPLLNKLQLPTSVFPIAAVLANGFQLVVGPLPLLMVITLIASGSLLNVVTLVLPLGALILICCGVGLLVSGLYVFFRDLPYFYELAVTVLLIGSPVFYPPDIVPSQVRPLLALNPLASAIECLRQIVLSGHSPDLGLVGDVMLRGVLFLAVGWICFHGWRSQFMDLL
jgi:ABC-type polysaccharide/polyol phosphate export permease